MEYESQFEDGNAREREKTGQDGLRGRPLSIGEPILYTVEETAEALRLSRSKVYELLYAGRIRSVKIGASRRVRRSDLEDYVTGLLEAS